MAKNTAHKLNPYVVETTNLHIAARDAALEDLSSTALNELTALLRIQQRQLGARGPSSAWLNIQANIVPTLNKKLQRPSGFIARAAISLSTSKFKPSFLPDCAQLCPAHAGLDPRVIRNLMLLVSREWTWHDDVFRFWRESLPLVGPVKEWLDRVDALTAISMGSVMFKRVYKYDPTTPPTTQMHSGCEACILAFVGGEWQHLADLKGSLTFRCRAAHSNKRTVTARLLHIVDSWIEHYPDETKHLINDDANQLLNELWNDYNRIKATETPADRRKRHATRRRRRNKIVVFEQPGRKQQKAASSKRSQSDNRFQRSGSNASRKHADDDLALGQPKSNDVTVEAKQGIVRVPSNVWPFLESEVGVDDPRVYEDERKGSPPSDKATAGTNSGSSDTYSDPFGDEGRVRCSNDVIRYPDDREGYIQVDSSANQDTLQGTARYGDTVRLAEVHHHSGRPSASKGAQVTHHQGCASKYRESHHGVLQYLDQDDDNVSDMDDDDVDNVAFDVSDEEDEDEQHDAQSDWVTASVHTATNIAATPTAAPGESYRQQHIPAAHERNSERLYHDKMAELRRLEQVEQVQRLDQSPAPLRINKSTPMPSTNSRRLPPPPASSFYDSNVPWPAEPSVVTTAMPHANRGNLGQAAAARGRDADKERSAQRLPRPPPSRTFPKDGPAWI
jgi:hypothetical protein